MYQNPNISSGSTSFSFDEASKNSALNTPALTAGGKVTKVANGASFSIFYGDDSENSAYSSSYFDENSANSDDFGGLKIAEHEIGAIIPSEYGYGGIIWSMTQPMEGEEGQVVLDYYVYGSGEQAKFFSYLYNEDLEYIRDNMGLTEEQFANMDINFVNMYGEEIAQADIDALFAATQENGDAEYLAYELATYSAFEHNGIYYLDGQEVSAEDYYASFGMDYEDYFDFSGDELGGDLGDLQTGDIILVPIDEAQISDCELPLPDCGIMPCIEPLWEQALVTPETMEYNPDNGVDILS